MNHKSVLVLLVAFVAALPGCGVRPVTGGTKGTLRAGGDLPSDIQVTVHEAHEAAGASWRPVGFGTTAADGSFQLVTNGASGPLLLPTGEYRCTLESVGAPVEIPKEYANADTTPLRVSWTAGDGGLDLVIQAAFAPQ